MQVSEQTERANDSLTMLKPRQVAEILGIGLSSAYEKMTKGIIPSVRIGGSVRCRQGALEEWIIDSEQRGKHG